MGALDFKQVTKEVESQDFDCGVQSINKYIKESYYALLAQHGYAFSIVAMNRTLGYIQVLFRDVQLDYFPDEISEIIPEVKNGTLSAVHIRFIAIEKNIKKMY